MSEDSWPDITIRLKWGGKDGKWRWLAEVGDLAKAGEERHVGRAVVAAHEWVEEVLDDA